MSVATLKVVENALKDYFKDPIITQLDNQSGPILAKLEKNADDIVGSKVKFSLEYGRSGGVGARAEDGDLPQASPRKYEMAEVNTKNLYSRLMLTDKLIKTSKDNRASFVNQFTQQMDNLLLDSNDMLRRNMVGTSTGVMGTITAAVSSATKEFEVDGSVEAFYPGQLVDFGTVSAGVFTAQNTSPIEIEGVDYDANKIYLTAATTCAANTVIALTGNYGHELTGIEDIMSADVLYGIDRTTHRWFRPTIIDLSSSGTPQDFDSLKLQKAIDTINKRTGETPDFIVCNDGVQRAYIEEQNTYKRNIEMMKVDGGYNLCSYNGIPISVEKYMKANTLDLINTKHMKLSRIAPWDWMDEDGDILSRVKDKAAYEATLVMYGELVCMKPATNARLTGIAEV